MKPYKNKITGNMEHPASDYPIATATAVAPFQVVTITAGLVVLQAANGTGAILGVAAESHSGSASAINPRENGTVISVWDNPADIFICEAPEVTATGGSTTTIISTNIAAEDSTNKFVDDDFNAGFAKLTYKGASSTNTDPVGTVYTISDYDTSDRTFTINTAGGAVTSGDKFKFFPPIGFAKGNLDSGIANLVLSDSAAIPFRVVGHDTAREKLLLFPTLHVFGNKNS